MEGIRNMVLYPTWLIANNFVSKKQHASGSVIMKAKAARTSIVLRATIMNYQTITKKIMIFIEDQVNQKFIMCIFWQSIYQSWLKQFNVRV